MGPGLVGPMSYPIRDPKSRPQMVGRIVNPVGYYEVGGLTGPGKYPSPSGMAVERAAATRVAKRTSNGE